MMRWTLRISSFLAILYYWFLIQQPTPSPYNLDLAEIRRLASAPGAKPKEIRVEHVADFIAPAALTITGGGWSQNTMWALSYELVYPDQHTVIIDTALNAEQGKAMGTVSATYDDAFKRMTASLGRATLILFTHEHPDHIGGLVVHPQLAQLLKTSVQLTSEQLADPDRALPARFPDHSLDNYVPLHYNALSSPAPGIVLVKAPGHSPGSQMIFVQLDTGPEFLFIGDIAWTRPNLQASQGRPRAIAYMIHENRAAVLGELQALRKLDPKVTIIPGHDARVIEEMIHQGRMKQDFF